MSDHPRWSWIAALGVILVTRGAAQDAPALERRMQRLGTLRRQAADAVERAQRARVEPLDTVRSGSLVVVVRPADLALVSRAAVVAWARLDTIYGDAARSLAAAPLLFFRQGQPLQDVSADVKRLPPVMTAQNATVADVAFQLVRVSSVVIAQRDTTLTNWLGPVLILDAAPSIERSHTYVELVTAPSSAVRRCYAGTVAGCAAALGIVEGDHASLWYDASERRDMVRRNQESAQRLSLRPSMSECLEQESDSACLQVLHALPWLEPPLSNEARQSLARAALVRGGRRAFVRLAASNGRPLAQRLALASGIPVDSLLQEWRALVIAAQPHPVTLTTSMGWMALAWSVVFGLLALRSTRWR